MDRETAERLIADIASDNDAQALTGLRGLQAFTRIAGLDLSACLQSLIAHLPSAVPSVFQPSPITIPTGAPHCKLENGAIVLATTAGGIARLGLPGLAAQDGVSVAASVTDAIVAAVINKTRMKLKLVDHKNSRGEVVETMLRAEYEREGMAPVQIWSNARGEVAALAAVLRKGLAEAMPELMAA